MLKHWLPMVKNQLNDKRYGIQVEYNSDTKTFSFLSGSTGERIAADGALGVDTEQRASNIQVGRYSISDADGSVVNDSFDLTERTIGSGDNQLMGVGATKTDIIFVDGRGPASAGHGNQHTGAGRLVASVYPFEPDW